MCRCVVSFGIGDASGKIALRVEVVIPTEGRSQSVDQQGLLIKYCICRCNRREKGFGVDLIINTSLSGAVPANPHDTRYERHP